jgi:hypothetical protein
MPNRILKESICASPNIDQLSDEAEAFFYRLIVNSDDYGRLDGRLMIIISRCYPLRIKSTSEENIINLLIELSNAKLINVFKKGDEVFIQIATWEKHQQVRAKKSKYPAFDSTCKLLIADDFRNQMIANDNICPRNPIQSNPIRNPIQSLRQENIDNGNGHKEIVNLTNTEVLVNKEIIEIPKKDNIVYVKTDDEGNPVKEKPPKKIKKETKWGTQLGEIFKFVDAFRGYKPSKRSAEAAAIIRMLNKNYTVEQITSVWKQLKLNDFRYKDKELFMMSVENDIGAKLALLKSNTLDNPDKFVQGKYGGAVQR